MMESKNLNNGMPELGNISILSNRCLEEVFSYLSIRERIKIQRVCKTWQKVSKSSFHDIRHLEIGSVLLGDNYAAKEYENLYNILKQIFSLCGSYLSGISLKSTCFRITGDIRSYKLINTSCPNLESIYLPYCNENIVKYLKKIVYLNSISFESCPQEIEWTLFDYLSHNENLRIVSIENNVEFTGSYLHDLPKSVESISIKFCRKISPELIANAVKKLKGLKSLTLAVDLEFIEKFNTILQCIPVNSMIERLNVCCFPISRAISISEEWNFQNLNNLQVLTLKGSVLLYDKTLSQIAKYCKKLQHVSFIDCEYVITDCIMKSFMISLKLESLFISKLRIQSLSYMTSVNSLTCHSCDLLDESSFASLIKVSQNLQRLDVMMCTKINVKYLIDIILKAHTRKEILEVNYMDRKNIVNVRIAASRLYVMKDSSKILSK